MKAYLIFVILYGLLPLLAYKVLERNLKQNIHSIIPFFIVVCIASLYEFFGTIVFKINSEYWFIAYKLLAFASIHYFFFKLLKKKFLALFVFFTLLFFILLVLYLFYWENQHYLVTNSYFNALETIVVLIFSTIWIRRLFVQLELDSLGNSPDFYFVSGLLLYYSGTVILFLLSSQLFAIDKIVFQEYWLLNITLNLILRTLLLVGIWKALQK